MKYSSTRGLVTGKSFEEALFSGYTLDGGLFVPECLPTLSQETIQKWVHDKPSYPDMVFKIVRCFISPEEIPDNVLRSCVEKAYSKSKFSVDEVVRLKECKGKDGKVFHIVELYHGPTASFKDCALTLVGQMMEYFICKRKDNMVVMVGTSGDTGSAAIKAMEGLHGIDIVVLYPDDKISPVQELQMNSSQAKNVHVFAVQGTSDDLDVPIRQCFPGERVCSINSINWARVMIQTAHFVYLYTQIGKPVDIFIPTGAAGNLAGGIVASLMGIPIKLFAATNANDNVHMFLNKGQLRMGGKVIPTPANAMDIRYAYNLERIIHFLSNSPTNVQDYMKVCELGPENVVTIDKRLLAKIREIVIESGVSTENEIHETMRWIWERNKYMICPHTATAVSLLLNRTNCSNNPAIVISTASPYKFPEVSETAGIPMKGWNGHKLLNELKKGPQRNPDRSMRQDNFDQWLQILEHKISQIHEFHAIFKS